MQEMRPVKSLENSVVQIGAWRVDPALDEISKDGQITKLEPKMMQLLLCLAAHAGQVVSVEQLLDEVWKDVIVTPDSVYHAVAALRRVLGDDRKDPSYIANVMRRGYRLIATVVPLGVAETPTPAVQLPHSAAENQAVKPRVEVPRRKSVRELTGRQLAIATVTVLSVALAYFIADRQWMSKRYTVAEPAPAVQEPAQSSTVASGVAFAPPPHSIAVLPLVNLSGDKEQEYFSDGLTEELLNSLAEINELQVAARTSSFSFKEHPDIATVARKLNVASVLEGSVRRSGHTVRVTVQLLNGVNGFHLWSHSYDRDIGDVLKLQSEIAMAVTGALKFALLGDPAARIEQGGTRNPAAFDAYLRGYQRAFYDPGDTQQNLQEGIAALSEAIRLDPKYALAFAVRSRALCNFAPYLKTTPDVREAFERAHEDANRAIALAPELGESHLSLALWYETAALDFQLADREFTQALLLAPGNVRVQTRYSNFTGAMGRSEASIAAAQRAVVLDPLHASTRISLAFALTNARRFREAVAVVTDAIALRPDQNSYEFLGYLHYLLGDLQRAREACDKALGHACLAITYEKFGQHAAAEEELAKLHALRGDTGAVDYAMVHAQWGDNATALAWLDTALRLHNPELEQLKSDPTFDPLRKEPRFQAIERALNFPN
jgi:TolB-like protein/DNA-binding winged helix-turn-helix (wHTH) protein/Tfp pilus assembly protein PilF